jgi:protein involved in polysaccharide export with SLBB domain
VKHILRIAFFVFLWLLPLGQSSVSGQEPAARAVIQIPDDDLVHFGDVLDVDVVGGFEYDWRGGLNIDGFLDGFEGSEEPIRGLCRSEGQIADDIARSLSKTLRDPRVVVRIVDRSNRALVRLDGAVRTPTRFRLRRAVSLRELLVLSGGLADGASGDVTIFRPKDLSCGPAIVPTSAFETNTPAKDNASMMINIKISDLLSGKAGADPQILSGDIITVIRALPIYVIGAVNNPRPIYSRDQMTLSRVVANAGGLAKDAEGSKVSIFRRDGLEVRSIDVDLGKIKRGETNDEVLRPFDIIEVASKGGGKRKYPPVVANDGNISRAKQELPLRVID